MTDDPHSPRRLIGKTLQGGRYAVSDVLGGGAQGDTLEAIDKRDGTLVAVKRFQVKGARSWKDVELAEREAKVLSRLSHELLPKAIAHFEEDGALYLVMERIEGKTLAEEGELDRADVIRFLYDAGRVLEYLHDQAPPVIHRDIKPSNVIRRPADTGPPSHVLVDFGSVRDSLKPSGGSTVVGTFGYMAPEQFQGRARPQSDVYAVGATALAMLTGQKPEELPHKGLAIDVRAALPDDPALAAVLERMLEPDPDVRPVKLLPLLAPLLAEDPEPRPKTKRRKRDGKERKRQRKAKRRERRRRRRERRHDERMALPPLVVPFVVIALTIARIAVTLGLRVVVPTILTLLSLLFGKKLRGAARAVNGAGAIADHALKRAAHRVAGRPMEEAKEPDGHRIEVEEGQRIDVDETIDHAEDEVSAALEEVADELEAFRRRKKRKRSGS